MDLGEEDRIPGPIANRQVWRAAEQYYRACEVLGSLSSEALPLAPFMHCAAIAIELYLKCLSAKDDYILGGHTPEARVYRAYAEPAVRCHKFSSLLKKIPLDIRTQLTEAFEQSALQHRTDCSLEQLLEQFEGMFAASRYPFEKESRRLEDYPPHNTLVALIKFLHEVFQYHEFRIPS